MKLFNNLVTTVLIGFVLALFVSNIPSNLWADGSSTSCSPGEEAALQRYKNYVSGKGNGGTSSTEEPATGGNVSDADLMAKAKADLEKLGAKDINVVHVFPYSAGEDNAVDEYTRLGFTDKTAVANERKIESMINDVLEVLTDNRDRDGSKKIVTFHVSGDTYVSGNSELQKEMVLVLWDMISADPKVETTGFFFTNTCIIDDEPEARRVVVSIIKYDGDLAIDEQFRLGKGKIKATSPKEIVFKFATGTTPKDRNEFDGQIETLAALLKGGGKTLVVSVHGDKSLTQPLNKDNESVATARMNKIKIALQAKIGDVFKVRRVEPPDFQQIDDTNLRKIVVVGIE